MTDLTPHSRFGRPLTPTILFMIALAGFGPLLAQFFYNLWQYNTYQFFPLALAGAMLLALRGLSEVERPLHPGSRWVRISLVLAVLVLLTTASILWSPWLCAASFLLALLTAAWWFGGWRLLKSIFPAWLVLLSVLPPPLKLDARFALLLQEWATTGSSHVLALIGIPHLLTGTIIEIPGQRLLVEEACSGINSVLFMTSACVFYTLWQRRSFFFLVTVYALTIACVLAGNLVRITSGAWFLFYLQIDLFTGWKHEALGLLLTAIYLGFIVLMDAFLAKLLSRGRFLKANPEIKKNTQPLLDGVFYQVSLRFVTVLLVMLGALQLVRGWDFHFRKEGAKRVSQAWMDGSAKFTLPQEINGWRLVSEAKPAPKRAAFEDGIFSHIWQYQKGASLATISFDYPFFGYHDVTVCYRATGWVIADTTLQPASTTNAMIPCMEVIMEREGGLKADLFYSTVDETGSWLEDSGKRSPYNSEGDALADGGLVDRITYRLRKLPYANEAYDKAINYRIQILAAARGGLSSAQRIELESLFRRARMLIAEQFITPSATPTPATQIIPNYEPIPNSATDSTSKAIEEAKKAALETRDPSSDATQKAIQNAIREAQDAATPNATH